MLYDKMVETNENRDVDAFLNLIDDDFIMVSHQTKTQRSKKDFAEMVSAMMSSDNLEVTNQRCVYENDDILIQHNFMSYPDDTRQAVMLVSILKDGKIISLESGATSLD